MDSAFGNRAIWPCLNLEHPLHSMLDHLQAIFTKKDHQCNRFRTKFSSKRIYIFKSTEDHSVQYGTETNIHKCNKRKRLDLCATEIYLWPELHHFMWAYVQQFPCQFARYFLQSHEMKDGCGYWCMVATRCRNVSCVCCAGNPGTTQKMVQFLPLCTWSRVTWCVFGFLSEDYHEYFLPETIEELRRAHERNSVVWTESCFGKWVSRCLFLAGHKSVCAKSSLMWQTQQHLIQVILPGVYIYIKRSPKWSLWRWIFHYVPKWIPKNQRPGHSLWTRYGLGCTGFQRWFDALWNPCIAFVLWHINQISDLHR